MRIRREKNEAMYIFEAEEGSKEVQVTKVGEYNVTHNNYETINEIKDLEAFSKSIDEYLEDERSAYHY